MAGLPTPSTTEPLPAELDLIATRVERRIDELLLEEKQRWSALDPQLIEPIESLRGLVLAGGKRLRPAFCHWGWVAAGGDPDDRRITDAGAAFELLQGFALIHDDVMDGSARRRGGPTVHRQFMATHASAAWCGEERRFGEGVAILVGDLAIVYADRLMPAGPPGLLALWDELRIELNIGQYLDLVGTATANRDRAASRRIARYKSGRYTIQRPLQLGATLAGRSDLAHELAKYGEPLGEAFQLRDDVLGVFGDSNLTGKPVGDDLREGKPTLLLAVAHERADAAQLEILGRVGDPALVDDEIEALQQVLRATGSRATVEEHIADLAREAVTALDKLDLTSTTHDALVDLAAFVVAREA